MHSPATPWGSAAGRAAEPRLPGDPLHCRPPSRRCRQSRRPRLTRLGALWPLTQPPSGGSCRTVSPAQPLPCRTVVHACAGRRVGAQADKESSPAVCTIHRRRPEVQPPSLLASCRKAKERRERLRFAAPPPDYISLGTGARVALLPHQAASWRAQQTRPALTWCLAANGAAGTATIPSTAGQLVQRSISCHSGSGLAPDAAGQPAAQPDKDASDGEYEDDGRLRTAFIGSKSKAAPGGVFGSAAAEPEVAPAAAQE